ncbi:MAG: efflux transporter outer membrane subunit [Flavobacterium sp.]|nr:efflux transporter outer membrane subunit [Candidatus Neoflavobacterium equi]
MRNQSTIYSIIGLGLGILILHSCAPQSKYRAPKYDMPEAFKVGDTVVDSQDSTSIANLSWSEFFNDKQLDTLISKGMVYNFDMQQALKNIEIANQRVLQSKVNWLPTITGTVGQINHQYRSSNFNSKPSNGFYEGDITQASEDMFTYFRQNITGMELSWELDVWGKMRNQKKETIANFLKTYEAQKTVKTQLVSSIAQAYYNLLFLNAQLEVAQSNFSLTENTLKIVELQYQSGKITALAKNQTKSQMLIAKALIPKLEEQIGIQENALNLLIGDYPKDLDYTGIKLTEIVHNDTLSIGVPLHMVSMRPDVRAAELDLQAKNYNVGIQQVSRYPNLTINLSGGVNSVLTENWFNIPGSLFGNLMGTIATPIFNKRKLKTNYEVSKIEREKSELQLQRKVYTAITEVSDALISLKKIDEQLEIAEEQLATVKLGIKQSNLLFNSGYATYLEIINTQKVALETELNYNKLKQQKLVARVKLYKALGGGWK